MSQQPNQQPMPGASTVVVNAPAQHQSQALPALVNVFLPGVGQLLQGRILAWLLWWIAFAISFALMFALIGFATTPLLWLLCIVDAAKYKPA